MPTSYPTDPTEVDLVRAHWVPVGPFRTHLRALLMGSGLPWRAVALQLGLPRELVRRMISPQPPRRIPADVAAALIRADVSSLNQLARLPGSTRVAVRGARRLARQGHDTTTLAHLVQLPIEEVATLLSSTPIRCSARTELLIRSAVEAHLSTVKGNTAGLAA